MVTKKGADINRIFDSRNSINIGKVEYKYNLGLARGQGKSVNSDKEKIVIGKR